MARFDQAYAWEKCSPKGQGLLRKEGPPNILNFIAERSVASIFFCGAFDKSLSASESF